jgi:protein SMG7
MLLKIWENIQCAEISRSNGSCWNEVVFVCSYLVNHAMFSLLQALELEKQLRGVVQAKGPFDSHARALRNNIRECYEAVVLEDHEFAEVHEVEQAIWRLHYKQIDEFRAKIKKNSAIAAAGPAVPIPGGKSASKQELMHKILAAFKSFLGEATGFYHNLILKLRAKHDLPQDYLAFEVTSDDDEKRAAEVKRCENSCHRCLIFLGDLARYKEVHGDGQDWSVSAGYYLQASALWPSSGNPHNQVCGFLFSWISYMGSPIFWAAY